MRVNSGVEPLDVFVETHIPPETLIIVGAGDVGIPLARMAKMIGLRVIVVDARERFATRDRFPDADEIRVGIPSEIVESLPLGDSTYVVLVVHDYKHEVPVLTRVLEQPVAYVGLLGSRRRGKALHEFLAEQGIGEDRSARIHVPVGMDIGARTAPEIAREHPGADACERAARSGAVPGVRAHRITRDALDPVRLEGMVLCEDIRDSTGRPALKKGRFSAAPISPPWAPSSGRSCTSSSAIAVSSSRRTPVDTLRARSLARVPPSARSPAVTGPSRRRAAASSRSTSARWRR